VTDALDMDFGLTEEQDALVEATRGILESRMTMERLKELDGTDEWFDRVTWAELAKADVLGVTVPEAHGGLGYGILDACLLLEQVGRTVAPVPLLHTLVSGAIPLAEYGTDEQQARWLPGVADGRVVLTAALTEAEAEPESPTTRATRAGDAYTLDGTKFTVPVAHVADRVLVSGRTDDGRVGVFLVDPNADGVSLARQTVSSHEPQFVMELTAAPAELLGDDLGRGEEALARTIACTRVGLCALAAGVAARALRITADYTTTRKQFDRAIGTFQAVGQRMADAYMDTEAIHLTMLLAATRLAEGRPAELEVATAKFWAAEGGSRVGHAALHVHGGVSIDLDYPIHRYFLWAKSLEFALGAGTPQLARIGRVLAAEPA
jgi:alkylation response protein AidB-like acyl-CoA dehydrogenase